MGYEEYGGFKRSHLGIGTWSLSIFMIIFIEAIKVICVICQKLKMTAVFLFRTGTLNSLFHYLFLGAFEFDFNKIYQRNNFCAPLFLKFQHFILYYFHCLRTICLFQIIFPNGYHFRILKFLIVSFVFICVIFLNRTAEANKFIFISLNFILAWCVRRSQWIP